VQSSIRRSYVVIDTMHSMKHAKTAHASGKAKAERRSRRSAKPASGHAHPALLVAGGPPFGPVDLRRSMSALSRFDPTAPWPEVAALVLPLLKRVRHPFPTELAPIHLRVPPGVWAGFGIDIGPAWAHVSRDLVARWKIDDTTLLGAALDNLRDRAVREPPRVEHLTFGDVPATVIQAQGWGSSLILAPDRLGPIVGAEPRTLLAPVRDSLIALPDDLDIDLAVAIWEVFAERRADELDVDPLRWTGTDVVTFEGEVPGLLN
jgi:hypothetical protein